jgi:hypothetical protein
VGAQEDFWKWFEQHQEKLLHFEEDRERIFDSLAGALRRVHSDLVFEFGPPNAKREFVISAGGIRSAFPAVVSLMNAAPSLTAWRVTAFRPRRTPLMKIKFKGKAADPKQVTFSLLDNGQIAGIRLFIPGFQEGDNDWNQIGYLLLDEALGEYDVETRLGLIKICSPDTSTLEKRYPFPDLPQLFDQLVLRLERRSGDPS